ncbi:MAG: hypothetical protein IH889_04685 [Planctomycetes bacterium]|nr:hypothetical protein [Planctomycetota bacterium]
MRNATHLTVMVLIFGWTVSVTYGQVVIDLPAPKKTATVAMTTGGAQPAPDAAAEVGELALARYARARSRPRDGYPRQGDLWSSYDFYGNVGYSGYWGSGRLFGWRGPVIFGRHHHHHHDVKFKNSLQKNHHKDKSG